MGAVNGPLTGMFLIGVLFPWANKKVRQNKSHYYSVQGVLIGALLASLITVSICTGSILYPPVDRKLSQSLDNCSALDIHPLNATMAFDQSHIVYREELYGFVLKLPRYNLQNGFRARLRAIKYHL